MNADNSETAEMLRKLMIACLAGLEASRCTSSDLAIDGGLPDSCRENQESDQVLL